MFAKKQMLAAVMSLTLASPPLLAAPPTSFECPSSIARTSLQVLNAAEGWTPFVATPLYLHAAAPMYGPPEMRGDLTGFTEKRGKSEWSYTYTFAGTYPEGKWLQCTYGEYNQVTLSRRLPDEIQECIFTYRKGAKVGQHDIKIACR